jgi:hypothetical protein
MYGQYHWVRKADAVVHDLDRVIDQRRTIMTMTESSIDDITRQARQGSVAAIIQILNDRLADCGVRTRAVLAQGMLQLLCEAETTDRLERDTLVQNIRQILSGLRPRNIRRVRINSRLVKEQQLLWLDEIQKDPENQLLWTEEIRLPRPNPIQVIVEDFTASQKSGKISATPNKSRQSRDRRQYAKGILGGAALSVLVIALGWVAYDRMGRQGAIVDAENGATQSSSGNVDANSENTAQTLVEVADVASQSPTTGDPLASGSTEVEAATAPAGDQLATDDPFAQAVLIAQAAARDGQIASTAAEWLDLASRWQLASDLMGQIPESDERYATAQDREALYRANREQSLQQADMVQAESDAE